MDIFIQYKGTLFRFVLQDLFTSLKKKSFWEGGDSILWESPS